MIHHDTSRIHLAMASLNAAASVQATRLWGRSFHSEADCKKKELKNVTVLAVGRNTLR